MRLCGLFCSLLQAAAMGGAARPAKKLVDARLRRQGHFNVAKALLAAVVVTALLSAAVNVGAWLCMPVWWLLLSAYAAAEVAFVVWYQRQCARLCSLPAFPAASALRAAHCPIETFDQVGTPAAAPAAAATPACASQTKVKHLM